jgi:formylglycine-generating enzyme required for sulfatase activity
MAAVPGRAACIDRYEASLQGGVAGAPDGEGTMARAVSKPRVKPAVRISQLQAQAACANAGKRLCTREEWLAACRGADGKRAYAYGRTYVPGRCHDQVLSDRRKTDGPLPTGSLAACRTPEGVYDLSGNVWEWLATRDPKGLTGELIGGGLRNTQDDVGCVPKEAMSQPVTQQVSGLGFRCCKPVPRAK